MMPDGLAEQTTAAEREGVGVEKFALAGGLAEWKTTIVLTRGVEHSVRKVQNFWVFATPSTNVDEVAVAHRHRRSHQDQPVAGSNPAKKVFQTFRTSRFLGNQLTFQPAMERSKVSISLHE